MNCPLCNGKMNLIINEKNYIEFKKNKFEIFETYYRCLKCGEKIVEDKTGDKNLLQVYNQYREKHKIFFPEEITSLRERYGLTKTKMSFALGWGENTYANYEKGVIPSESHNSLMKLIEDPEQFLKLVELRNDLFSDVEREELKKRIEKSSSVKKDIKWFDLLWPKKIGSDTGYTKPNLEKFTNMIIYFAEKEKPYKTKLNKLLFYSDFTYFKNYFKSISGARYRAIKYGPVPSDYDAVYNWLSKNKIIDIKETEEECGVTEKINPLIEFHRDLFTANELDMIEQIYNKFKDFTPSKLRDYSHKEEAWKENKATNKIIDYQKYAVKIRL